jgi:putative intracellular protease/amidase
MNSNVVYLYVFDTMADWEVGFLTAELNTGRYFRRDVSPAKVVTVGLEKNYITTMGGLRILPDVDLAECNINEIDALILPGGETWMESINQPILRFAKQCIDNNLT